MGYDRTLGLVILVLGLIPGMFGFLAWELKENWRLYRANQPKNLVPQAVSSHGEHVIHLIRPGFHSGTLPKLFARLRRAHGRAERKGEMGLHHLEDDLRRFVERDLLAPLAISKGWNISATLMVGHLHLATNRIRIEVCCPGIASQSMKLEFANRGGWLLARLCEPGWLTGISSVQRDVFVTALTGFYKHAGVDLVAEHIEAQMPGGAKYQIRDDILQIVLPGEVAQRVSYNLALPDAPAQGLPPGEAPVTARPLLYILRPVSWQAWVERWEEDQASKEHEVPLLPGVILLPAGV